MQSKALSLLFAPNDEGHPVKTKLSRVTQDEHAIKVAEAAMNAAKAITEVKDELQLEQASEACGDVADIHGKMEQARTFYKAPFLAACKLIDDTCNKWIKPLGAQKERLQKMMGAYTGEKKREALQEQHRLERLASDAAQQARQTDDPAKREMWEEAHRDLHLQSRTVEMVAGVRLYYDAEVVDWNLLEANYPQTIEKTLKKSIVNDIVRRLQESGIDIEEGTIPGLKLTPADKACR